MDDMDTIGRFGTVSLIRRNTFEPVSSYPVDDERTTFGRDPKCSIRMYFSDVDVLHGALYFEDGKAYLHVRGRAGILVDDVHVPEGTTIPLNNGSRFQIWRKLFQFNYPPRNVRSQLLHTPRASRKSLRMSMIRSAVILTPRQVSNKALDLKTLQSPIKPYKDSPDEVVTFVDSGDIAVVEDGLQQLAGRYGEDDDRALIALEEVDMPDEPSTSEFSRTPSKPTNRRFGHVDPQAPNVSFSSGQHRRTPSQLSVVPPAQPPHSPSKVNPIYNAPRAPTAVPSTPRGPSAVPSTPRRRSHQLSIHKVALLRSAQRAQIARKEMQEEHEVEMTVSPERQPLSLMEEDEELDVVDPVVVQEDKDEATTPAESKGFSLFGSITTFVKNLSPERPKSPVRPVVAPPIESLPIQDVIQEEYLEDSKENQAAQVRVTGHFFTPQPVRHAVPPTNTVARPHEFSTPGIFGKAVRPIPSLNITEEPVGILIPERPEMPEFQVAPQDDKNERAKRRQTLLASMQNMATLPDPSTRGPTSPTKRLLFTGFDPLSPVKDDHRATHTDMLMDIDFGSLGDMTPKQSKDVDLSHLRATISKMKRESVARLSSGGGILNAAPEPKNAGDESFDEPILVGLQSSKVAKDEDEAKPVREEDVKSDPSEQAEPDVSMQEVEQAIEVDITEGEVEGDVEPEAPPAPKTSKRAVPMPSGFKPQRTARNKAVVEPKEAPAPKPTPLKTRRGRSATQSPSRSSPRRSSTVQPAPQRIVDPATPPLEEPAKPSRGRSTTRLADRANAPVASLVEDDTSAQEVAPKAARSTKSRMPMASNIGAPRTTRTRQAASVEREEGAPKPGTRTKRSAPVRDQADTVESDVPVKRARQTSVDITDSARGAAGGKRQIPTRMLSKSTRKPAAKQEEDKENTPEPKPSRSKASSAKSKVAEGLTAPAGRSLRSRAVR